MHDFDLVAVDFDLGAIYPIDVLRSATSVAAVVAASVIVAIISPAWAGVAATRPRIIAAGMVTTARARMVAATRAAAAGTASARAATPGTATPGAAPTGTATAGAASAGTVFCECRPDKKTATQHQRRGR